MKQMFSILLALALFLLPLRTNADEDPAQALKEKHEPLVFAAMTQLTRYGCDDANLYRPEYFLRSSNAWNMLERFDSGWFTRCKSKTVSNLRAEHWTYVSATEFCVDVYCDFTCDYSYAYKTEVFPCAYHLCFRQTNATNDTWQVVDFFNITLDSEIEYAQKLTDENEGIMVYPVTGPSYIGYMAVIDDPSRVFVGTIDYFGSTAKGMRIDKLTAKYSAVGGINGGGFSDSGGTGTGGQPSGLIISNGNLLRKHSPNSESSSVVIGFDQNDTLIVGKYSSIDSLNLRDAMAFNAALIVDGKNMTNDIRRLTLTTRTAIGQDADGRVLMLVIEGRQPNSLGASFADLAQIMLEFGAINAGNLDGGTSTTLYLNNASVYSGYRLDCSRNIPAAFLIKPVS